MEEVGEIAAGGGAKVALGSSGQHIFTNQGGGILVFLQVVPLTWCVWAGY